MRPASQERRVPESAPASSTRMARRLRSAHCSFATIDTRGFGAPSTAPRAPRAAARSVRHRRVEHARGVGDVNSPRQPLALQGPSLAPCVAAGSNTIRRDAFVHRVRAVRHPRRRLHSEDRSARSHAFDPSRLASLTPASRAPASTSASPTTAAAPPSPREAPAPTRRARAPARAWLRGERSTCANVDESGWVEMSVMAGPSTPDRPETATSRPRSAT